MSSSALTTVGIVGGGQLAQMLCQAAPRVGVDPVLYLANDKEPAAQVCTSYILGDWNTPKALQTFFETAPIVIFENEFIPCDLLAETARKITDAGGPEISFRPWLNVLSQIQDKLTQKKILDQLSITTTAYDGCPLNDSADPEAIASWVDAMIEKYDGACVFKWAKFGYDGKGTWICPGTLKLETQDRESLILFCNKGLRQGGALYVEKKIQFRRELAMVACFSRNDEFKTYPLVVSEQRNGICRLVTGPAVALGVPQKLEDQARQAARKLATNLKLVGTFAIEFFETEDETLLVNEIAPRVHNSGHYTQDASTCSQFENHLRAILGMPLGDTSSAVGFAMLNLIGNSSIGTKQLLNYRPPSTPATNFNVHWYGKQEVRDGRKMGHINSFCHQASEVKGLVQTLEVYERTWVQSFG